MYSIRIRIAIIEGEILIIDCIIILILFRLKEINLKVNNKQFKQKMMDLNKIHNKNI